MKKVYILLLMIILISASMGAAISYDKKEDTCSPKFNRILGPFVYFWLQADFSTEEFAGIYYNHAENQLTVYVYFLPDETNTDSYIKWGSLVNGKNNPNYFKHDDPHFYNYFWFSIDNVFEKNVQCVGDRILVNADGTKGMIYWTCEPTPIHDPTSPSSPAIIGCFYEKPGVASDFTFYSRSYEDFDLSYYVDWGDGTDTGWTDTYPSCKPFCLNHKWAQEKIYKINVQSKDSNGNLSGISTFDILISSQKSTKKYVFEIFYEFLVRFILISKILTL